MSWNRVAQVFVGVCAIGTLALLSGGVLAGDETAKSKPAASAPEAQPCGLKVGEKAPAGLTLLDKDGKSVALSEMYAKGPIVVTFYRGEWCPFCTKALAGWQDKMGELKEAGGTFVAISPEASPFVKKTIEKSKADYMVLSDAGMDATKGFKVWFEMDETTVEKYKGYGVNLGERNANGKWELPAPATFVVDREGVVRYAFADWDYRKRANMDEVIAAVRGLKS